MTRGKNKGKNAANNGQKQPDGPPKVKTDIAIDGLPEELAGFLSDFAGLGCKASLYRKTPLNYSGFLESYPLDSSLLIENIKEAWGGKDFLLRILDDGGRTIGTRSFKIADVPRVDGIPLSAHIEYSRGGQVVKHDPSTDIVKGMQAQIEAANQRHEQLMMKMMEMSTNHAGELRAIAAETQKKQAAEIDPMKQMKETFNLFNEMKSFTDQHSGGDGDTGGIDYMEMFKLFREEMDERRREKKEAENARPRLSLPGATQPTARAAGTPPQSAAVMGGNEDTDDDDDEEISLSDELLELGPEGAAVVVAQVLNGFSPLEQKAAIDALMKAAEQPDNDSLDENQNGPDNSPLTPTVQGGIHGEVKED